jgi:hypothetical protein
VSNEPEHKMLFDVRGKRKRVIQVIYVLLALVMVASLVVIGLPGGIGFGGGGGNVVSQDAAELSVERAERLEQKVAEQPNNANAQAELVRARIAAGNGLVEVDQDSGRQTVGDEATEQYNLATDAWNKYLKTTKNQPDQGVAQLVSGMLFSLSQGSSVAQFEANIRDAAEAQAFVVESAEKAAAAGEGPEPTGQLVTLATYQYYAQDYGAAEASRKRALAMANSESEREQINTQLDSIENDARRVGKTIKQARKQAQQGGGESLQDPLGQLGSGGQVDSGQPQP